MTVTAIFSILSKLSLIIRYIPDLIRIGKAIYEIIKKDESMETPSTIELLEKIKEGESDVKKTFEEIQNAFSKTDG